MFTRGPYRTQSERGARWTELRTTVDAVKRLPGSIGQRKLVGAAGFLVCAALADLVGLEGLPGVLLLLPAFGSWLLVVEASIAQAQARADAAPRELAGLPRVSVARAIVASVFLPGAGHLLLGWDRKRAAILGVTFIVVVIAAIVAEAPSWAGIALAAAPWLTAQYELRRRTGWWWPPLPSLFDLGSPDVDQPGPFAHARDLPPDDPRRGWRGRE